MCGKECYKSPATTVLVSDNFEPWESKYQHDVLFAPTVLFFKAPVQNNHEPRNQNPKKFTQAAWISIPLCVCGACIGVNTMNSTPWEQGA